MVTYLNPGKMILLCKLAFANGDERSVNLVHLRRSIYMLDELVVKLRNHSNIMTSANFIAN